MGEDRGEGALWIPPAPAGREGTILKQNKFIHISRASFSSREVPINQTLRVNDREVERAQFAGNAAPRCKEILQHESKRDLVLGKFLFADITHAIALSLLFEYVENFPAAGFRVAVKMSSDRGSLFRCFICDFLRQTKIKRARGASLHTERLFVLAETVAAHGALGSFMRDVVLGDDFPRTGMDAVLASDAHFLVDDDGAFFVFRDRFHRANRRAGGKVAVHAAVARPKR